VTLTIATSEDLIKNMFLKTLFSTKSNDLIWDLFIGHNEFEFVGLYNF